MTATTTTAAAAVGAAAGAAAAPSSVPAVSGPPSGPRRRKLVTGERLLRVYTWLILFWLVLPIVAMIAFGFNDTEGKLNNNWQGFTLRWWGDVGANRALVQSLQDSLTIALVSTIIATALGMMIGLSLGKYTYRGKGAVDVLLFSTISAPEIVLGSSLLSLFITIGVPRGFVTILIAHAMFNIAYVAIVVRARVAGLDPSLEEASRDLGAGPFRTFALVTLPNIAPGVMSGALLAFALSIDEYIITYFVAGSTTTFPLWVFGATRVGIPPQVNVLATIVFVGGALLAVVNALLVRRR